MGCKQWKDLLDSFTSLWNKLTQCTMACPFTCLLDIPSHSAPLPTFVLIVPRLQNALISKPKSWVIFQSLTQGNLTHEHQLNKHHHTQSPEVALTTEGEQIWNWLQEVPTKWRQKYYPWIGNINSVWCAKTQLEKTDWTFYWAERGWPPHVVLAFSI